MKRTLADIEAQLTSVMDELLDAVPDVDIEPTPEQQERMTRLQEDLDALVSDESAKVDGIGRVLTRFSEQRDACEVEADRLRKRARSFENKREHLAGFILDTMERWEKKRLTGAHTTLTRIQNPPRVEVGDATKLPFQFQNVTYMMKPLAASVRDAIEAFIRVHFDGGDLVLERIVRPKKDDLRDIVGVRDAAVGEADVRLVPGTWRLSVR
jgi:Siphovirus Gp157